MFLLKIPHHSRDSKEALNGNSIASATGYEVMAVREQVKKRRGAARKRYLKGGVLRTWLLTGRGEAVRDAVW